MINPAGLNSKGKAIATERLKAQGFDKGTSYRDMMSKLPNSDYANENNRPKAYMVWMLFDSEMKLVKTGKSSGAMQIPEGAGQVKQMAENEIVMDQGGFLTAYTVNESPASVYIDNFQLSVAVGKVLEINNYYPFGMINEGITTPGISDPLNNYKYNGKELQKDLSLEWLDYGARFYDPQIGRFTTLDPHTEKYAGLSPYVYVADNPLSFVDPTGKDLIRIRVPDGNGGVMFAIVDSKIAQQAHDFAWKVYEKYGAVVTESYRTDREQQNVSGSGGLKGKVGKSRHQQGFAVDFGVNAAFMKRKGHVATNKEKTEVGEYGESISNFDWRYGLKDYPHFELDATEYGYDSFQDAYKTNRKDFKDKGGKNGIPIMDFSGDTQTNTLDSQEGQVIKLTKSEEIIKFIKSLQYEKEKEKVNTH